jgi:hypothetical protein
MKTLKWRLLLSVSSLVVAAILFQVGLVQERTMHKNHPDYFYEFYPYTPPALTISYSLNAPSLLLTNFIGHQFSWSERWFPFGKIEYYIIVFAFWWCVGWGIDAEGSLRDAPPLLRVAGCLLGSGFAMLLAYVGFMMPRDDYGTRVIPISMVLWGLGLLAYFGTNLMRRSAKSASV